MNNEKNERRLQQVNVEELLAELEVYRWRDKKALIVKRLGSHFLDLCYIIDEVDELMLQGYTFDEIVRAIKEHIAEQLAEEKRK